MPHVPVSIHDTRQAAEGIAAEIAEIAGNPLIAQLADRRLGTLLDDGQIATILVLVQTLEAPRRPVQPPAATFTPNAPLGQGQQQSAV